MVFYSAFDEFAAWKNAIEAELPDLDVVQASDEPDPALVRYGLVWKPPIRFFERYPGLKLVTILGAGVDFLVGREDLPDVPIARISDPKMARMMAGYVLFAVLRHARDIPAFEAAQRERRWHYIHPRNPEDIRVGILGLGELGSAAALECARQGFQVSGWSRSPKALDGVRCVSGAEALPDFLAGSEIIVCMLPLTPETERLLDAEHFAMMRTGTKFINVSRGKVVDEDALIAALRSGHIAEATLDVFDTEPLPPENPLWSLPGVLITPHLSSIALPASAAAQLAENVRRIRRGEEPLSRVEPKRGY
jgi:glyoxylate/hydroxypyruvate reductase A